MSFLKLKAYLLLIYFDLYLARGNFEALHERVRRCRAREVVPLENATERICLAMDMACIWYWKEARCLQRSAATTCLLRWHGVGAQLVIGAQQ